MKRLHSTLCLTLILSLGACASSSPIAPDVHGDTTPSTPDTATGPTDTKETTADTTIGQDVPSSKDIPQDTPGTPGEDTGQPEDITDTHVPVEDTVTPPDTQPNPDATQPPADVTAANCDAPCPEGTVCNSGTCGTVICGLTDFDDLLFAKAELLAEKILITQQPDLSWAPSKIYQWPDLLDALYRTCVPGIAGFSFWTGAPGTAPDTAWKIAAVNLAAFLAQSMKETIRYDACDENNWDDKKGYPLAGACGQLDQKYEDYDCDMACPKDPSLQLTAVTNASWEGAPGPLFCAPDSVIIDAGKSADGTTGVWNHSHQCWPYPAAEPAFKVDDTVPAWMRKDCEVYVGQKAGKYVFDGSSGSVEGCCWWGRGVIQTTGRCNFGILNHYLGQTHLNDPKFPAPEAPAYSDVNFCKNPESICSSKEYPELKWIAGLFYWMTSLQAYEADDGWTYTNAIKDYVEAGLTGDAFIDAVSGIVNRGCHNPPCETGPVDGLAERRENFEKTLQAMGLK